MPDNSFDVVSIVDLPEVLNAVQQASKEILTRFDLKNSKSEIQLNEKDKKITVTSIDEFKLKAVVDILQQKLVKRKVPLKNFVYNPVQPAAGSTVRQEVTIQSGLAIEKSKEIVRTIKDSKIKVQASIQGDLVRVSGKVGTCCRKRSSFCANPTSASNCSSRITGPTRKVLNVEMAALQQPQRRDFCPASDTLQTWILFRGKFPSRNLEESPLSPTIS